VPEVFQQGRDASGPSSSDKHAPGQSLNVMPLSHVGEGPAISPRMTAVFGGLFGLATMASVVALLIQVFPVENQRELAAQAGTAEAATAAASGDKRPKVKKRTRKLLPSPWRVDELSGSHLVVRGTMKRRSFIVALNEAGVPKKEVYRILKAMDGVRSFDKTGRNHAFAVAMKRGSKRVVAFEYEVDGTEIYQARTKDGLLKGGQLDMKVREVELATSFYIGPKLKESYQAVGLEAGLLRVIDKAFNGRTSHEAFEEGGVVKLIVVEKTALGRFVRYEHLRALEYRPADPSKKPLRAYWFEGAAVRGYVDEKGRRPSNRGWRTPMPGAPITSHFNPTRMHPVLKRVMPHNGTDFGAPNGAPVYAAYRGKVSWVGMHGASGNLVSIQHPGGIQTGYAHLSRFAKGIKTGDRVGTRQLIGYVGSTGRSTGPHLHFSAKRDGKFFNAIELKMDALHVLPVSERARFLQQKKLYDLALEKIPLPDPPPEPEPAEEPAAAQAESSEKPAEQPESDTVKPQQAEPDSGDELLGDDLSGDIE
jgi:murein DD-endopeptidase MepM/ murein hydrolase activator NlpD